MTTYDHLESIKAECISHKKCMDCIYHNSECTWKEIFGNPPYKWGDLTPLKNGLHSY